jgi:hypothetical protein
VHFQCLERGGRVDVLLLSHVTPENAWALRDAVQVLALGKRRYIDALALPYVSCARNVASLILQTASSEEGCSASAGTSHSIVCRRTRVGWQHVDETLGQLFPRSGGLRDTVLCAAGPVLWVVSSGSSW